MYKQNFTSGLSFPGATRKTKDHKASGLSNRHRLSGVMEAGRSKANVSASS